MKRIFFVHIFAVLFIWHISLGYADPIQAKSYTIPLVGNAFEVGYSSGQSTIDKHGAIISGDIKNSTRVYFKVLGTGELSIGIKGKSNSAATVQVSFRQHRKTLQFEKTLTTVDFGQFNVPSPGYYYVDLLGLGGRTSITDIVISGTAVDSGVIYANNPEYYYWARRGPSCHLGYLIPTKSDVSYYYNEIVVPIGEDVIGSYYMANGFGQGYFGIQVNSPTERRVLFSVWSPFHTDDPKSIPEEERVTLLKKGSGVHTGEFGNEGSGGQSYLKYNWKAGLTYKFLLKGMPDGKGNTDYTAWFFSPAEKTWMLIASFKRPKTSTYLKGFYSFLENFDPNRGNLTREVNFNNQWVYDGAWKKIKEAKLTVDATYHAHQRIDATGGTTSSGYFLKMGGFFNVVEKPGTVFQFNNLNNEPEIDFSTLP